MEKSSFFSGIYFSGLGIGIGIVAVFTLTLTNNNPSNEPNKYSKQHFDHVTHKRIIPMLEMPSNSSRALIPLTSIRSSGEDILMDTITDITTDTLRVAHIYKSFHSALLVLKLHTHLYMSNQSAEVKSAVASYLSILRRTEHNLSSFKRLSPNIKLIAVEGLQKSGKTTLVHTLVSRLRHRYRTLPSPVELDNTEGYFNTTPDPVRHAYSYLRNYIAMNQIFEDYLTNPQDDRYYFIDTFYHHTLTSTIMSQVELPDDNVAVPPSAYSWPLDLPIPNMVIYINTSTYIRLRRVGTIQIYGHDDYSVKERDDTNTRNAYALVQGPLTIGIDGDGDIQTVCNIAIESLAEYGFVVPRESSGYMFY